MWFARSCSLLVLQTKGERDEPLVLFFPLSTAIKVKFPFSLHPAPGIKTFYHKDEDFLCSKFNQ